MESEHPDLNMLSHFVPLETLGHQQLNLLSSIVKLETANPGTRLMEQGNNEDISLFLVKGKLKLIAKDGKSRVMDAKDHSARAPIAQLRPRMYHVDALTSVQYIKIENHLLTDIHKAAQDSVDDMSGYVVNESSMGGTNSLAEDLAGQMMTDLENDQLKLPSLPDVAVRIGRALRDDISDADKIAAMIQVDPVITAKLIKAANSAMYGRAVPVETCANAVVRLGTDVTHKLVVSYAMKELFRSTSKGLQDRMEVLWKHSTRVAAICYVLGLRDKRFSAEHALLVGLLHDIGAVAILNYASNMDQHSYDDESLDKALTQLKGKIGALILSKWSFGSEFATAAAEGEEWMRNPGGPPDYCDVVIAAQLHSYIGSPEAMNLPAFDQIPAHERLGLGELTPKMSLKILERAKEQISEAEALLNI